MIVGSVIAASAMALVLTGGWLICAWWYRRIHNVGVRWWAIPFTHGALLFARRLHPMCEKPWRKRRPSIHHGCCQTPDRCIYPTGCALDQHALRKR